MYFICWAAECGLQDQQRILKKRKLTLDELASHYQGLSFCKTVEAATDNCYGFYKFYVDAKDIMSPTNTVGDTERARSLARREASPLGPDGDAGSLAKN